VKSMEPKKKIPGVGRRTVQQARHRLETLEARHARKRRIDRARNKLARAEMDVENRKG
jgi:hypothetical protein